MVRRWLVRRPSGWWWRALISGLGALATGLVMTITGVTKFHDGAWIVLILGVALVAHFLSINRHYREVARQLSLEDFDEPPPIEHTVLVLVGDLHKGVVQALQYARTLSPVAKAVYVETDPEKTRRLEEKWGKWGCGLPLVVLSSPYRMLLGPLLDYLDHLLALGDRHMVTIIIPEFIPAKWWQHLLHNQTALVIKGALLFRKNVVVTDVPYHLSRSGPRLWYTDTLRWKRSSTFPVRSISPAPFPVSRRGATIPSTGSATACSAAPSGWARRWHGYELRWTGEPRRRAGHAWRAGARSSARPRRRGGGGPADLRRGPRPRPASTARPRRTRCWGTWPRRLHGLRPTLMPEPFEMLVGAICAQQVNLTFAFSLRAALVRRFGTCPARGRGDGLHLPGARRPRAGPRAPSSAP